MEGFRAHPRASAYLAKSLALDHRIAGHHRLLVRLRAATGRGTELGAGDRAGLPRAAALYIERVAASSTRAEARRRLHALSVAVQATAPITCATGVFDEDRSRIRTGNGPAVMPSPRNFANALAPTSPARCAPRVGARRTVIDPRRHAPAARAEACARLRVPVFPRTGAPPNRPPSARRSDTRLATRPPGFWLLSTSDRHRRSRHPGRSLDLHRLTD
jgi:hypothetical protein